MRVIGYILLFIGIAGVLAAKGGSREKRSESAMYGVAFSLVGGIILGVTKSSDEDESA